MIITCTNVDLFSKFFHCQIPKIPIYVILHGLPPYLNCVAILYPIQILHQATPGILCAELVTKSSQRYYLFGTDSTSSHQTSPWITKIYLSGETCLFRLNYYWDKKTTWRPNWNLQDSYSRGTYWPKPVFQALRFWTQPAWTQYETI